MYRFSLPWRSEEISHLLWRSALVPDEKTDLEHSKCVCPFQEEKRSRSSPCVILSSLYNSFLKGVEFSSCRLPPLKQPRGFRETGFTRVCGPIYDLYTENLKQYHVGHSELADSVSTQNRCSSVRMHLIHFTCFSCMLLLSL